MGIYYKVVNVTRKEAFQARSIKYWGTAYDCGPLLALLMMNGHWKPGEDIRIIGDNGTNDNGYYGISDEEEENWPEPKALANYRDEVESWRDAQRQHAKEIAELKNQLYALQRDK